MNELLKIQVTEAHKHSIRHEDEIKHSSVCGCFCCLHTFTPAEVEEYLPERGGGKTAFCPYCDMDSVIGDASGYPITREFLSAMRSRWF